MSSGRINLSLSRSLCACFRGECSSMAMTYYCPSQGLCRGPSNIVTISSSSKSDERKHSLSQLPSMSNKKRCLRCRTLYFDKDNSPSACAFHGHTTGEKGLFSLAPPHQGIDGEWSDRSGVIVYKWNDRNNRPSTGRANWKRRWSCCAEYDEKAPPCRRGWHVSYDDGFTLH